MKKVNTHEKIIEHFQSIEIDEGWSFENCTRRDTGKWTHNYHRYPAKFISQMVEKLMGEYIDKEDNHIHINDPFYGSGTTIVTGISKGFRTSGTDINKIAHLITKVKSTPINPDYLNDKINDFLAKIKYFGTNQTKLSNRNTDPLIPYKHIDKINYWFTEENKIELGKILRTIYEEEDQIIREFLLVGFSHILKNSSIWLQRSTKPTRDLEKEPTRPYKSMRRHLSKMKKGNEDFFNIVPRETRENLDDYLKIEIGDARRQPVQNDSVDLIITSSPYVVSYEYADLHQLSTIWLDLTDDLTEYKKEFIGTRYKKYEDKEVRSEIAKDIIDKMEEKNHNLSKRIGSFFIDMEEAFDESYRILKPGGRCCYVIGNTTLREVDILNAEFFAESIQYSGFKLDRIIKREIPQKILPQKRDKETGRFTNKENANREAYPIEYIIIGKKE